MNVYDFDKTICKDDTETDFFFYEMRHHPINIVRIPYYFNAWIKFRRNKISREEYRNRTYLTLKNLKDVDKEVTKFWNKRIKKMLPWYLKQKRNDDVIISATPRFLLEPILNALGITNYIVSEFDVKNRKCIDKLNYGEEKVKRFALKYNLNDIDEFYTDSLSDAPMLLRAKKPFLVDKKYNIVPWNNMN